MGYDYDDDPGIWGSVLHTREAIRARTELIAYTLAVTAPFVLLVSAGAVFCGLLPHEVAGVTCYNAMITSIFFFDTLRNAAHASFAHATELGLVRYRQGIPLVDPSFPEYRLARIAFAIGGRATDQEDHL